GAGATPLLQWIRFVRTGLHGSPFLCYFCPSRQAFPVPDGRRNAERRGCLAYAFGPDFGSGLWRRADRPFDPRRAEFGRRDAEGLAVCRAVFLPPGGAFELRMAGGRPPGGVRRGHGGGADRRRGGGGPPPAAAGRPKERHR